MNKNQKQTNRKINQIEHQIGTKLHQARLIHRCSLKELYNITKIQIKYLNDIDKGEFFKLPGDFYVRAFIKKYADSVGLNGAELLKDYNNRLPDPQDPNYINQISEDRLFKRMKRQGRLEKRVAIRQYIPIIIIIIVVLIFLFGGWLISTRHHPNPNTYNHSTVSLSGTWAHKTNQRRKKRPHHLLRVSSIKGTQVIYRFHLSKKNYIQLTSSSKNQIMIKNGHHLMFNKSLKAHQKKNILLHIKGNPRLSIRVKNYPKMRIMINNRALKKESRIKRPIIILT